MRFEEISEDIKEKFMEVYNTKAFATNIGFQIIADVKMKQVIKIQKLSEVYQFLLEKDVLVIVNEDLYDKLDDESIDILIEQELDKISVNIDSGKIIMNKPDIITFSPIIAKYGSEAVLRANQVEILASEQKEDMVSDFR